MLKSVKVQDYMTTNLITFMTDTALFDAIRTFTEKDISGAPVVDDRGELIGMLSEVDCLRSILSNAYHEDEKGGKVGDFMTTELQTVEYDADIIKVAQLFISGNKRRLPVLKEGKLVGQISRIDVLRAVKKFASKTC
jgi:CBS domain-containing protein